MTPTNPKGLIIHLCKPALVAALLLFAAPAASAGTARLSFTHDHSTTIVEYRAVFGFAPGTYSQEVSLGLPAVSATLFTASIDIPDDVDVYVAVVAVDASGNRSAPSNERVRFMASNLLGAPGQPQLQDQ